MRVLRGRGGPWAALTITLSLVITAIPLANKAYASGTDYAASSGGGSINSSDFTNSALTIDSDDTTAGTFTTWGSNCNSYGDAFAPYNRVALSGGSGLTIAQVHVILVVPCFGTNSSIEITCGNGGYTWTKGFPITSTTTDADLDLTTGGSGYSGKCTTTSTSVMSVRYWMGGNGGVASLFSFKAYDAPQSHIADYVYDLEAVSVPFGRQIGWRWKKDFRGHWAVTRTVDSSLVSFHNTNTGGASESFKTGYDESGNNCATAPGSCHNNMPFDLCGVGGCTSGGWDLTITDTLAGITVSFHIAVGDLGKLIPDVSPPAFAYAAICYNNTGGTLTVACKWGSVSIAAGKAVIRYTLAPQPSTLLSTVSASVSAGPELIGPTAPGTPPIQPTIPYSATVAQGTYTTGQLSVDTAKNPDWLIYAKNESGSAMVRLGTMDFATSGTAEVKPASPSDPQTKEVCGAVDPACAIRNFGVDFNNALHDVFDIGVGVLVGAWQNIYGLLKSKQPFAFIVDAVSSLTTQVGNLTAETTSTNTCPGYVATLPTLPSVTYTAFGVTNTVTVEQYAYNNANVPVATPFSVTLLKCSDLEPTLGSNTWQAIRTMLGPVIFALYGFKLVKEFGPKFVLNG